MRSSFEGIGFNKELEEEEIVEKEFVLIMNSVIFVRLGIFIKVLDEWFD